MPELAGIHHVKFAVSDIERSVAWYERVFGFKVTMEFKDDQGIVRGSVGQLAGLDRTLLAFRENKELSEAVTGFDPVSFAVEDRADVEAWVATSTSRASRTRACASRPSATSCSSTTPTASSCTSTPTARRGPTRSKPDIPGVPAPRDRRGARSRLSPPHQSCLSALMV